MFSDILDQATANIEFMEFWNSVYAANFVSVAPPTRNAFMEIAFTSFLAGMNIQRINSEKTLF